MFGCYAILLIQDGAFSASCLVQWNGGHNGNYTSSIDLGSEEAVLWRVGPNSPINANDSMNPRVSAYAGKVETGDDVYYDPNSKDIAVYTVNGATLTFSLTTPEVYNGPDRWTSIVEI